MRVNNSKTKQSEVILHIYSQILEYHLSESEYAQVCFAACVYMHCRWISSSEEKRVWIPLIDFTRHSFGPIPSQDLDFQSHRSPRRVID